MARYKVKEGLHFDADGKRYEKGEIVESDKNLVLAFPQKFEALEQTDSPEGSSEPGNSPTRADGGRTEPRSSQRTRKGGKNALGIEED